MAEKRDVFLWVLYDFANSLAQIVFVFYFAQWIVVEKGLSDLSFNSAFIAAAVFLFFIRAAHRSASRYQ